MIGRGGSGLAAAVMISNPTCLEAFTENMGRSWSSNVLYNMALAHKLKEYLRQHRITIRAASRIDYKVGARPLSIDTSCCACVKL